MSERNAANIDRRRELLVDLMFYNVYDCYNRTTSLANKTYDNKVILTNYFTTLHAITIVNNRSF